MSEEFTGERLIPGEVDPDLWNEHISRYAFAASLCKGSERVLDAGCGTGYGSGFLSRSADSVLGIDASSDAIEFANRRYRGPNTSFLVGLCESLPVPAASVNLIVAFEVIEHLAGWRQFLQECERVLKPNGILLVSTPNKLDYTESRGAAGPNPFHVHEFEFAEFSEELGRMFPDVRIFGQNHAQSIVFSSISNAGISARLASSHIDPERAAFFVAVCSKHAIQENATFVYVPESGNVLRERERHIRLLRSELDLKDAEFARLQHVHSSLVQAHRDLGADLERSNTWAESLDRELQKRGERIVSLQEEAQRTEAWALHLDREVTLRADRIIQLQSELAAEQSRARESLNELHRELESRTAWARARDAELAHCVDLLHAAEATIDERTRWAQQAQAEVDEQTKAVSVCTATLSESNEALARCSTILAGYETSRWVKLGQAIRLGPLSR